MFLSSNGLGPLLKLAFYVFLQGGNKDAELPVTLTFWQLYSAVPEGNLKKEKISEGYIRAKTTLTKVVGH